MHCNVEFYYVVEIQRTGIEHPSKQRRMVFRHRNTVVGSKCTLPSALLVSFDSIPAADGQMDRQTHHSQPSRAQQMHDKKTNISFSQGGKFYTTMPAQCEKKV